MKSYMLLNDPKPAAVCIDEHLRRRKHRIVEVKVRRRDPTEDAGTLEFKMEVQVEANGLYVTWGKSVLADTIDEARAMLHENYMAMLVKGQFAVVIDV